MIGKLLKIIEASKGSIIFIIAEMLLQEIERKFDGADYLEREWKL